jgi:hypothetical protein
MPAVTQFALRHVESFRFENSREARKIAAALFERSSPTGARTHSDLARKGDRSRGRMELAEITSRRRATSRRDRSTSGASPATEAHDHRPHPNTDLFGGPQSIGVRRVVHFLGRTRHLVMVCARVHGLCRRASNTGYTCVDTIAARTTRFVRLCATSRTPPWLERRHPATFASCAGFADCDGNGPTVAQPDEYNPRDHRAKPKTGRWPLRSGSRNEPDGPDRSLRLADPIRREMTMET